MNSADRPSLVGELRQRGILDEAAIARLLQQQAAPWYVTLLAGLAAWLAALLLLGSTLITLIDDNALAAAVVGAVLLALAVWLLRQPGVFVRQLGLALSMVGQGLLVLAVDQWGLNSHDERIPALLAAVVAGALLLVPTMALHRLVCALIMLGAIVILIGLNALLTLYGLLLAALAVWAWLRRSSWAVSPRAGLWRALAGALTLAGLLLPLLGTRRWLDSLATALGSSATLLNWLYPIGAGVLLLGTSLYLLRGRSAAVRLGAALLVLMLIALGVQAPGLLIAAALWLAVFHACERFWSLLVGLGASLYLFDLYYSLHITLLHKSILLVVCGAALLLLRWYLLGQWRKSDAS